MNRSTVNQTVKGTLKMFGKNGWYLPPDLKWDITGISRIFEIIEDEPSIVKFVSHSR